MKASRGKRKKERKSGANEENNEQGIGGPEAAQWTYIRKKNPFEQKTRGAGTREEIKHWKKKERKEVTNETNHEQSTGRSK